MGCCKTREKDFEDVAVGTPPPELPSSVPNPSPAVPLIEPQPRSPRPYVPPLNMQQIADSATAERAANPQIPHKIVLSPLELALRQFHREEEMRGSFGPVRDDLVSPREIIATVRSEHSRSVQQSLDSEDDLYHGVPLSLLHLHFSDPEFRQIENYSQQLLHDSRWRTLFSCDGLSLSSIPSSKYTSETPVYLLDFDFKKRIPADFLLDCADDCDMRAMWDTRLLRMRKLYSEIGNFFTHYHVLRLSEGKDVEFLCKFSLRQAGKCTIVVLKSVANAGMDGGAAVCRGKVQFAYFSLAEKEVATRGRVLLQFHINDEGETEEDTISTALFTWMKEYRENALKIFAEIKQRLRLKDSR